METVRVCTAAASYADALSCACGACAWQSLLSFVFSASPFRFSNSRVPIQPCNALRCNSVVCGMRERCKVACEARYSIVTKEGWFCVARYSRSHSARASLEFFAMSHLCPYRQLPSEKFALPNLSVAGSKSLSRPNAQQNTWLLAIPCGEKDESEQRMSALRIRRNKLSLAERPLRLQQ